MFDVVVIGAGLSGLQAAYSAQQAGLSVVVVEARNRVGGKTWSVPLASGRGYADLGAAWINDTTQPRIWSYTQKFGLEVVKQRLEGQAVMQETPEDRLVYPFGITPEVSMRAGSQTSTNHMLAYSSLSRTRRTWRISETTSKLPL